MKKVYFLVGWAFLLLSACGSEQTPKLEKETPKSEISKIKTEVQPSFQRILDSAKLNGVLLIFDPQTQTYHSNDFARSQKGFIPASTFKIPNSIIALETGVVEDEKTVFKWDGKKRWLKAWEQDLTFKEAFQKSCVPCYQEIARKVGVEKMQTYLEKLGYEKMVFDSTSIDNFWLEGNSKISAMEQIDFLQRLYKNQLPIASRTQKLMKEILLIDENSNYRLSGKTGWAIQGKENLGWFVGYLEKEGKVYFMATNVDPKENFNMKEFPTIRLKILKQALREINIL